MEKLAKSCKNGWTKNGKWVDGYTFPPTGSFSKVVLSQGAVNQVFLGVFLICLTFFHSKIWAKFHFGTFEPYK